MLDDAQQLAELGLRVFALQARAKVPATPNGCKDGTVDPAAIAAMWAANPARNIGVATGLVSGVVVLDVDGPDGARSLAQWVDLHGELPATPEVATARGRHVYFAHPGELCELRNSASKAAPGIDVRTDGGYVVAPPSVHPSGEVYRWRDGTHPSTTPFAPMPDWLLRKLLDATSPAPAQREALAPRSTEGHTRYGLRALDTECMELARAGEGGRNAKLNAVAFRVGQLVAAGHLVEVHAANDIRRAARACKLPEREIENTLRSGLTAGLAQPNPSDPRPDEQRARNTPQRSAQSKAAEMVDPQTPEQQAQSAAKELESRDILTAPEVAYCALVHLTDRRRATMARSGFPKLDAAIGGLPDGTMMVVGGRTGAGKSSLLLGMALNLTRAGKRVGIVSCEDAEWLWGARLICALRHVSADEFFAAHPSPEAVSESTAAVKEAERFGLHFTFKIGKQIGHIVASIRALVKEHKCDVIMVDYLQAISAKGADRYVARTDAAQEIKGTCHDLGVALVLASQLKRPEQGNPFREPTNNDLKDSGDIENMAESIVLLWPTSDVENAPVIGKVTKVKWSPKRPKFGVERNPYTGALTALVDVDENNTPQPVASVPAWQQSKGWGYGD